MATCAIVGSCPHVLLTALAVFVALCGTGLVGVLVASDVETNKARDLAANGIGAQVTQSLKEALMVSMFGSELLASAVVNMPRCADLEASWDRLTTDIMSRVDSQVVKQLELDVAGVIWKTAPLLTGSLASLYGRDLLKEESDRPGMLYSLRERRTLILGPYTCSAGFKCAFTVSQVFLPAPSEDYDWGCGYQPYDCPPGLCWDPVNKTKYWGQVSTMLDLNPFLVGSDVRLQMLRKRGYDYRLWQEETSFSNPFSVLANSTQHLDDPVVQRIQIQNLAWVLELRPRGGWVPAWRNPCIAAVVLGSVLVALLVLWLLVSREQHNRLLQEMLPPKVIQQLQSGANAIAEHFESVTVLFSDIVGYTTVASNLTPFQVVTLLNELFTVFDDLVHRNGVYKVETIGDALMCVAGCPVPQEPAANAERIARMALDMVAAVEQFRPSLDGLKLQIRIGIHSGPVVAGVVGRRMPRYCLFGDTVNTASRMESTSLPMCIQVSASTAELLRHLPGSPFVLEHRGPVAVKGKGVMDTYFLRLTPCAPDLVHRVSSVSAIVNRPARPVTLIEAAPPSPRSLTSRINTNMSRLVMALAASAHSTASLAGSLSNDTAAGGIALGTVGSGGAGSAAGGGGSPLSSALRISLPAGSGVSRRLRALGAPGSAHVTGEHAHILSRGEEPRLPTEGSRSVRGLVVAAAAAAAAKEDEGSSSTGPSAPSPLVSSRAPTPPAAGSQHQ
ncbi:hypothetical protein GPECTOR_5g392 [Gonium pectorale]|uniref:Guanylate cyclase domain-containing protein n=1 Tax=Gonium pectorale TaxID=33097 RepID=A0A150GWP1_GONPE|nr:hypothetical protein GPECTOR_5g392 [Gonium pectorale]|eukprot:KXZ54307.1 hypothetical protein GPECTOR_5g392 [Gonium pectorale]